ncbi:MAG: tRNA guanosine(34) transglycosylase Tgt [Ignavibacteria bacterium]|nr:tRNA guanosine(34) transglycosylase Tgt [Ignavibacteria bacterium]
MNDFYILEKEDSESKARAGRLFLNGTEVLTPVFMPVGTQGTVKAMLHRSLTELGYKLILCNTYHLYLRPGLEVIKHFDGLHNFISWRNGILTDSGGYQVFSLQEMRKLTEEGVEFRSHIDGSSHFFTPEFVIEIQKVLGSDILMLLDECTSFPVDFPTAKKSMELTLRWAGRGKKHFEEFKSTIGKTQYLFGIVQGSIYKELRKICLSELLNIGFDGYAIGGLAVGEPEELMYQTTDFCTDHLPKDRPRYLMGVGTPENILNCIELGIDMFDCVLPTRNARNGQLFTTRGKINIRNAKYKFSKELIDEGLRNYVSQNFTLGYLRHLFLSQEILAIELATFQNLAFYNWLVTTAREKILEGKFRQWKNCVILNFKNNNN